MKKIEIIFGLLRLPVDFVMSFSALILAYYLRKSAFVTAYLPLVDENFLNIYDSFIIYSLALAALTVALLSMYRMYSLKITDSIAVEIKKVFLASIVWLMIIVTYFFLKRSFPFSRSVVILATILQIAGLSLGRFLIHKIQNHYLKKGYGIRRLLLLGDNPKLFAEVYQTLKNDHRFKVIGYLSSVGIPAKSMPSRLKLGNYSVLEKIFKEHNFDDVVHLGRFDKNLTNEELLGLCRIYHRDYQFVPDIFGLQKKNVQLGSINALPIFRLQRTSLDGWSRVIKRIFDILVSFILIIVLSPFLLLMSLGVKLTSKGPLFFTKKDNGDKIYRAGIRQKPFVCLKFRTMQDKVHSQRYKELADQDLREGSPLVKIKHDPRITKIGHFLRRFDLDELPQLFNVLKGEMSLVGPRPHLLEEVAHYKKYHHFVFTIKPGITGLAQVNGRSDLDFEQEITLDSLYIEDWTLWLDLKILAKTILVVFRGHGENSQKK